MLKILVLHWGSSGGGPRFTQRMAKALAGLPDVDLHVSYSEYADNAADWRGIGVPEYRIKTYRSSRELVTGAPRWIASIRGLRRYIRDNEIDVVYAGMLSLWPSLAMPFTVPRSALYASSIHDAIEHPGEQRVLIALARRREISRADVVVAYSEHAASGIRHNAPRKNVIAIRHGADESTGQVRSAPIDSFTLGFFGRIVEYKGLDLFVETLQLLCRRGVAVRGLVVGNGVVPKDLLEQDEVDIEWDIRWVDEAEIDPALQRMDVLLLPYKEASQSGVVTQAASNGVPVVATPVGGLPQQVTEMRVGRVAAAVDASELADEVEKLLADSAAYERYSAAALTEVRDRYSWHAVAVDLRNHLALALKRASQRNTR